RHTRCFTRPPVASPKGHRMCAYGLCSRAFIVAAAVTFGAVGVVAAQTTQLPATSSDSLRQFLRKYLSDSRSEVDSTARFVSAAIKGHDGSVQEVVAYITGREWCGSGGCTMLILQPRGSSFEVIGRTTIVKLPIRVLPHTTNGRNDIGVWVQGGGILRGYEAVL